MEHPYAYAVQGYVNGRRYVRLAHVSFQSGVHTRASVRYVENVNGVDRGELRRLVIGDSAEKLIADIIAGLGDRWRIDSTLSGILIAVPKFSLIVQGE